jgi:hypothetical protein
VLCNAFSFLYGLPIWVQTEEPALACAANHVLVLVCDALRSLGALEVGHKRVYSTGEHAKGTIFWPPCGQWTGVSSNSGGQSPAVA